MHEIQVFKVLLSLKVVNFDTKMYLNFSNFSGTNLGWGGTSLGPKTGTSVRWGGLAKFSPDGGTPPSPPGKKPWHWLAFGSFLLLCPVAWVSPISKKLKFEAYCIHHSKYWMPIHYDTIIRSKNKNHNLLFSFLFRSVLLSHFIGLLFVFKYHFIIFMSSFKSDSNLETEHLNPSLSRCANYVCVQRQHARQCTHANLHVLNMQLHCI